MVEEIQISTFDYEEFNPQHAALYQRTWKEHIESGQGIALTEQQIQAFYHQNPEGIGLITVATQQGNWVGSIAAVPTRYGRSLSDTRVFYQLADIIVDPSLQGQGVGSRLIAGLTEVLSERNYPTYGFPNLRSSSLFQKAGYQKVREIPTRIFLPQLESFLQRSNANLSIISLSDAEQAVDILAQERKQHNSIIKDGAYIKWRYEKIRDLENYQFLLLRSHENQILALIVTTFYRFSGLRFLVVLDLHVKEESDLSSVFSKNISGSSPFQLGFSTIDSGFPKVRFKAAFSIPTRLNPRPVELITLPNCDLSYQLANSCHFVTADWLGF
jgi:predicted N-acetyltransferase YhbS